MKYRICATLLAAAFGWFFPQPAPAESVNVVALNIEWFPGQKWYPSREDTERHIRDTRLALETLAPDIFVGTEICDEAPFRDVLQAFPDLTLHVISAFSDPEDPDRRNQQIAIASRLPAIAGWAEPWEATIEGLRRGFTFVALENPKTKRLILVYGLHLKSNLSNTPEEEQRNYDIRNDSIRQLLEHQKKMAEQFADRGIDGWIVAGDINTNHDGRFGDRVVEMLVEAGYWNTWINIPPEERHTWKGRVGRFDPSSLDYILLKGFGEPDASLVWIDDAVSDHNAVQVLIELPDAP